MSAESKFIITRQTGDGKKFLEHIGHKHQWTTDPNLAMEYTNFDVARPLADKMGGKVETV